MAHFAQLIDGVVTQVVVVDNKDCGGGDYPTSEPIGQAFLAKLGLGDGWLQCSYNGSFRRRLPGIGSLYDAAGDAFYPPSPGQGWVLDRSGWDWVNGAGVRLPMDRKV